jgi:predicted TIM-barrel fold metal-dependent hydrolase
MEAESQDLSLQGQTSRRELIGSAALAGLGMIGVQSTSSGETTAPPIPIIDTHQHLWDLRKFKPPWLKGADVAKINRPSNMEQYRAAAKGLNVVKTIYMEVDVDPRQQVEEAEWVEAVSRSGNTLMVGGTVSARPASPQFRAYVMRFKGSKYIKGVRQVLQVPDAKPGLCLTPEYVKSIRLCGELGLRFDLCMRPAELSDGAKLADLCPHTQFVLDHCGNAQAGDPNWTRWERDIANIAKRKNVVCKVSGIIKTVKPGANAGEELDPIVRHVIECFGPDRVMFGSDWPVCTLTSSLHDWVEALKYILRDTPIIDQKKLFHDNAAKFYGV